MFAAGSPRVVAGMAYSGSRGRRGRPTRSWAEWANCPAMRRWMTGSAQTTGFLGRLLTRHIAGSLPLSSQQFEAITISFIPWKWLHPLTIEVHSVC